MKKNNLYIDSAECNKLNFDRFYILGRLKGIKSKSSNNVSSFAEVAASCFSRKSHFIPSDKHKANKHTKRMRLITKHARRMNRLMHSK